MQTGLCVLIFFCCKRFGGGCLILSPSPLPLTIALCFASRLWAFLSFQGVIDDRAAIFGERFYLLKSHLPSLKRYIDVK